MRQFLKSPKQMFQRMGLRACLALLVLVFTTNANAQTLIAGWDFQTTTSGGTAVLASPSTPTQYTANFGSGTMYLNGTNGSSTWVSSATASLNQLTGFGGTALNAGAGFATTTTAPACLAPLNSSANGKFITFLVNMTGYSNLVISYATQKTSTGFATQTWEYSTNGTTWNPIQVVSTVPTSFAVQTLSTVTGLDNISTAYVRLTLAGATAAAGNNRLDNIQFNASVAAAPVVTSNSATGTVGTPFSYFISATNTPTSYSSGTLPAGLTLNTTTGEISGTPSAVFPTTSVAISATNGTGTGNGTVDLTINQGSQTITFGALSSKTFGDAPFALSATGGGSGNAITYASSNTSVATISGNTVTIVGAGTTTITASQAGNADYTAAVDVPQTLTVNQATQTITFNALPAKLSNDAPFALTATGGASGNPITYVSSNTAVATIAGNIVTIVGAGSTDITASQAGNANYAAAADVIQTQVVNTAGLLTQTITFNPLSNSTYGDGPLTLTATASSGLPVSYTSSNTSIATISGNQLTILTPGTITITASQAGNGSYYAAANVPQSLTIDLKNLTVSGAIAQTKSYDGTTTATIDVSGASLVGIVGLDNVSIVNGGGNFASANAGTGINVISNLTLGGTEASRYTISQPSLSADITPASQVITFNALPTKFYGNAPYSLSATGGASGNPVTFVSDNPAVITISGSTATVVGVGTANITASQLGDANYAAAADVIQVQTVNQSSQFISFAALPSMTIGDAPFALTGTSTSGLTLTYTSSNPAVATVSGNTVTIVGVGNTDITASQAGDVNYLAATNVVRNLVVNYPTIMAWDVNGLTGGVNNFGPSPYTATTINSGVTSTGLIRAAGVGTTATAAARGWGGIGWNSTTAAAGIAANKFITFNVKPITGNKLDIASMSPLYYRRSASGAISLLIQYSFDGVSFTDISTVALASSASSGASAGTVDLAIIPALQGLNASHEVTFRLVPFGASGATGTFYLYDVLNTTANDFGVNGIITPCTATSSTTNLNVCPANMPYTWNSQVLTTAGTYTFMTTNAEGCDSTATLVLTTNPCNSVLNVNVFLQGYYTGSSTMAEVMTNQGYLPTPAVGDCDDITIELHDAVTTTTVAYTANARLLANGTATVTFPSAITGNYYIVIKHRSSLQTWSTDPVTFGATTAYDFTTAATQAYADNMVEVETGVWAIYTGDLNQDDFIDSFDFPIFDLDATNGVAGVYVATDLNGDGFVDSFDYPVFDVNAFNGVSAVFP